MNSQVLSIYSLNAGGLHQVWSKGEVTVVKDGIELFFNAAMTGRDLFDEGFKITEIVEPIVQQVRAGHVRERSHYRTADKRRLFFKFIYEAFNAGTLEVWL